MYYFSPFRYFTLFFLFYPSVSYVPFPFLFVSHSYLPFSPFIFLVCIPSHSFLLDILFYCMLDLIFVSSLLFFLLSSQFLHPHSLFYNLSSLLFTPQYSTSVSISSILFSPFTDFTSRISVLNHRSTTSCTNIFVHCPKVFHSLFLQWNENEAPIKHSQKFEQILPSNFY